MPDDCQSILGCHTVQQVLGAEVDVDAAVEAGDEAVKDSFLQTQACRQRVTTSDRSEAYNQMLDWAGLPRGLPRGAQAHLECHGKFDESEKPDFSCSAA